MAKLAYDVGECFLNVSESRFCGIFLGFSIRLSLHSSTFVSDEPSVYLLLFRVDIIEAEKK